MAFLMILRREIIGVQRKCAVIRSLGLRLPKDGIQRVDWGRLILDLWLLGWMHIHNERLGEVGRGWERLERLDSIKIPF